MIPSKFPGLIGVDYTREGRTNTGQPKLKLFTTPMRKTTTVGLLSTLLMSAVTATASEVYLVNVTADAMALSPATNELGSITFTNDRSYGYRFKTRDLAGNVQEGTFYVNLVTPVWDWVDVRKRTEESVAVYYDQYGRTVGRMTLHRETGFSIGDYQISGVPIGVVSGKFSAVRLRGTVIQDGGRWRGHLTGDNEHNAPQVLGIGPGQADDYVGDISGKAYSVSINSTTGETMIVDSSSGVNPWAWFRGKASRTESPYSLIVESGSLGSPWTTIATLPLPFSPDHRFFRVVIK